MCNFILSYPTPKQQWLKMSFEGDGTTSLAIYPHCTLCRDFVVCVYKYGVVVRLPAWFVFILIRMAWSWTFIHSFMEERGMWNHLTAIAVSVLQSSVHLGVNYQYHWVVITVQCYFWIMGLYSLFMVICFLLPPSWHTGSTCDYIPPRCWNCEWRPCD